MTTLEILKAARALISDPKRWCQNDDAVDEAGELVEADDPKACRWCALGAMSKVWDEKVSGSFLGAHSILCEAASGHSSEGVVKTNDILGHSYVLEMYDRAIEIAKRRENQEG